VLELHLRRQELAGFPDCDESSRIWLGASKRSERPGSRYHQELIRLIEQAQWRIVPAAGFLVS